MNDETQYRVYPNEAQSVLLQKTFGCARFIWNKRLADIRSYYEKEQKTLYPTPAQYKADHEWLKEVDSLALANVQLDLKQAFQRFFRDKKTGYPYFKSKRHSKKSYTTNLVNGNIIVSDRSIRLPKLGEVKIKKHRTAPEDWKKRAVNTMYLSCMNMKAK